MLGILREARTCIAAMSRHLKTLRRSGLVEEDRDELDSGLGVPRVRLVRSRWQPWSAPLSRPAAFRDTITDCGVERPQVSTGKR